MTNELRPYGAVPVQMRNGSPWTGKTTPVILIASDIVASFNGDLVAYTGTAALDPDSGIQLPVVEVSSAADIRLAGAIVRHKYDPVGFLNHREASTLRVAYIPADRDVLYSMQEDAVVSNLAATDTEANIDFVAGAGGSTVTSRSSMALNSDTADTTTTLPLRLVRLEGIIGNDYGLATDDGGQWLVTINQDAYSSTTGL